MACSLDLRTFSPLFRPLSDVKALEIYFRYLWNPLAYNYITITWKKPKLSRLVGLILSNHVVIRSLSRQVLYLPSVVSSPFVVLLINMLVRLITAFSFFDVPGVKKSPSFGLSIGMRNVNKYASLLFEVVRYMYVSLDQVLCCLWLTI